MLNFSWSEIILIGIVGMIFVGPKDLPQVMRWLTDTIKKCRKLARELHSQVDEVLKEADLKEVHEQFRQLRQLNIRHTVMNLIDKDGSLQETFHEPPLSQSSTLNSFSQSAIEQTPSVDRVPKNNGLIEGNRESLGVGNYLQSDAYGYSPYVSDMDIAALEQSDPAPSFIPPPTAQRLQIRRASPPPPSMIPPSVALQRQQGE